MTGLFIGKAQGHRHPTPRPGVTAAGVLPASKYADFPHVAGAYEQASEIPAVLDGVRCYCDCFIHFRHRSLLDCFRGEHGADCGICQAEVAMAYQMSRAGSRLGQIRVAIDGAFAP